MAKDSAQRVREYRARKEREARQKGDPTDRLPGRKFYEYMEETGRWSDLAAYLDWLEIDSSAWPAFKDDKDTGYSEGDDEPNRGSIGRAERMVGLFLDAAIVLSEIVSDYKKEKIDQAIKEIENSDLSDPADRKKALREIVRLNKYKDQLSKNVRRELQQWRLSE